MDSRPSANGRYAATGRNGCVWHGTINVPSATWRAWRSSSACGARRQSERPARRLPAGPDGLSPEVCCSSLASSRQSACAGGAGGKQSRILGLTVVVGFADATWISSTRRPSSATGAHRHLPQTLPAQLRRLRRSRYFSAGTRAPIYDLGGVLVGVNICEGIWYPGGHTD
jgi:hypothetical protein